MANTSRVARYRLPRRPRRRRVLQGQPLRPKVPPAQRLRLQDLRRASPALPRQAVPIRPTVRQEGRCHWRLSPVQGRREVARRQEAHGRAVLGYQEHCLLPSQQGSGDQGPRSGSVQL